MHFTGLLIGIVTFFIIGVFHPIVVKCEYYFTDRVWPIFLIVGILFLLVSLFVPQTLSIILSIVGITCLWSIGELKEQRVRVKKGWFPKNPAREASEAKK